MELTKLHRERAVDAVYQALRQAIVSNGIRPGERLNVDDLARRLGVSLTPVRGAIQQLATEGLVEIRPRSGTFVASLSAQDVEETYRIRCALECLAAEDAIHALTAQDIRRLKDLVKHLKKHPKNPDEQSAYERYRTEVHQVILQAAGNKRLQEIYDALNAHIKIARLHAAEVKSAARLAEDHADHEAIVDALEAKDLAGVVLALRRQSDRAKQGLVAAVQRLATQPPGSEHAAAAG
ncbi:MAG: GntR family transcriptional regulator [Chloroflexi bacterium]|nr:GntR family transcriptional regulator [Chloroflexota bacterium]